MLGEDSHPLDSLNVYQVLVGPMIEQKTSSSYEQAVELIERIGRILARLGRGQEFVACVESIRAAHKRKRSLMQLLDQMIASFPSEGVS